MKTQHTKGNWEPLYISGVCMGVGTSKSDGYSQVICNTILPETDEDYIKEREEIEANSKLIAAAPDLLNACIQGVEGYENGEYTTDEVVRFLKDAINKATK